jgi:hypothetical protein
MEKIMIRYSEKLKDPRWQKKRLKILERDEFACNDCGDTESTLMVHHLKYAGDPWEIEDKYLITLCEDCHESEHESRKEAMNCLNDKLSCYLSYELTSISIFLDFIDSHTLPPGFDATLDVIRFMFSGSNNHNLYDLWKEYLKVIEKNRSNYANKNKPHTNK